MISRRWENVVCWTAFLTLICLNICAASLCISMPKQLREHGRILGSYDTLASKEASDIGRLSGRLERQEKIMRGLAITKHYDEDDLIRVSIESAR